MARQSHRQRLVEGALECLRTKGYARTTARDITTASGANLASIGYHFGSKEALLHEAMSVGFAAWVEELGRIAFAEVDAGPLERLRASWLALGETFEANRPLMVAFIEAIAETPHSEELRERVAELYEAARTTIGAMVEASFEGQATVRARILASFLLAVCDGLLLQWLVDPERAPSGEELVAALEDALPAALAAAADAA